MKCGEFLKNAKNKITIQKPVFATDNYGSSSNTWTEVSTPYAWVKPVSTFERVNSEQLRGTTTHKMIIRYDSALVDVAIVSTYRILLDSRIHAIRGIKLLDGSMKNYGKSYIEIKTDENAVGIS